MSDLHISALSTSSSSLTQAQSDLAIRGLRNPSTKDRSSKIDKAAHDFESILVGQFLEKAEKSFATVPGTDPDQERDPGRDQFQSIACQFLAQGLGKTGSFGIASMISKNLAAAEAKQTADATRTASGGSSNVNLSSPMLKNDK